MEQEKDYFVWKNRKDLKNLFELEREMLDKQYQVMDTIKKRLDVFDLYLDLMLKIEDPENPDKDNPIVSPFASIYDEMINQFNNTLVELNNELDKIAEKRQKLIDKIENNE